MSEYKCTVCGQTERVKADLKRHLLSPHDRLQVHCVWCEGKELTKRKAGDLKQHVQDHHKSIYRKAPPDCFGEPGCFYLAKFPKDYSSVIRPSAYGSPIASFLRKAVEDWHHSVGEKASRTLRQWKEGWTSVPLLSPSPSPTLDYDEKLRPLHLKLHQLTVDSKEVKAMVYEEFLAKLSWYKVIISSAVRSNQKMMASLLRRMDQVQPFGGVVPSTFAKQLEGDSFHFARARLTGVLKIDTNFISKIWKEENVPFAEVSEAQEPTRKKFKTTHAPVASEMLKHQEDHSSGSQVFPLDALLPIVKPGVSLSAHVTSSVKTCTPVTTSINNYTPPVSVVTDISSDNNSAYPGSSSLATDSPPIVTSFARTSADAIIPNVIIPSAKTAVSTESAMFTAEKVPSHQTALSSPPGVDLATKTSTDSFTDTTTVSAVQIAIPHVNSNPDLPSVSTQVLVPFSSPLVVPSFTPFQAVTTPDGICLPKKKKPSSQSIAASSPFSPAETETIDEKGDHPVSEEYTVNAHVAQRFPSYSPTPKSQLVMELPLDLRMRAEKLLRFGCMPLLPPSRRNWAVDEAIILPAYSLIPCWPPKGWATYTSDVKLLLWETVSTALALHDDINIDRGEILDTYNFLALPGSGTPQLKSTVQTARYCNFQMIRAIYVGKSDQIKLNRQIVSMLEAASSTSFPTVSSSVILEQIEKKGISIRV